ncbi:MAG: hypothetical protein WDA20_03810 [Desulfuromonadales bacterium]
MKQHDSIIAIGLTVFSGLVSFLFVFYAVNILSAENASEYAKVFAYVSAGYGLGNVYILSAAWRGSSWTLWANKLIAFCFFGVFLMHMVQTGVENNLEYLRALGMAGVLWLNWFAVKKISRRTALPVQPPARKRR